MSDLGQCRFNKYGLISCCSRGTCSSTCAAKGLLYMLIWNKVVASQMAPARLDETTISLSPGLADNVFTTSNRVQRFDGYLVVYQEAQEESNEEGAER